MSAPAPCPDVSLLTLRPRLRRIHPGGRWPLHDTATTRQLEAQALAATPPFTLMRRAGVAVARLARALHPHARTFWIFCGHGNNGGDGWVAAQWLHQQGARVRVITQSGGASLPEDAHQARAAALAAGVPFGETLPEITAQDACIDALMGLGPSSGRWRAPHGWMAECLSALHASVAPVLHVDLPSGLMPDSGAWAPGWAPPASEVGRSARATLSLLTLHPGLFTAQGRDAAGMVWWDALDMLDAPCFANAWAQPSAWLSGPPTPSQRPHASHKGSWGDVAVLGGEGPHLRGMGMGGAAVLAARSALHAGAGRVMVALLDEEAPSIDLQQPDLMWRTPEALDWSRCTVVCGCGGGEAIRPWLLPALEKSHQLVLDADALNAIAASSVLQQALQARNAAAPGSRTVLTPHPLEAARLLGTDTATVQADRLAAAQALAVRFQCTVVLKGSGSILAAPGQTPCINPTGNARLGTAGTGDVLAGWIGAYWAQGAPAWEAASHAVYAHGATADAWPQDEALTASRLAQHALEPHSAAAHRT